MSFNTNDIKDTCSTPKEEKEEDLKVQNKEGLLSCTLCKYTCKKETSIKKHMVTKHDEHQCKECKEKLPTFMELLKHIAKQHSPDQGEEKENPSKDDEIHKYHHEESVEETGIKDLNEKDTDNEYVENDKEIVLSESMLDDVLLKGY